MDRAATRLSLLYGGGDPRWFYQLSVEDQARVLGYVLVQHEEAERTSREARRRAGRPDRGHRAPPTAREPQRGSYEPGEPPPFGVTVASESAGSFWFGGGE